jgi:hypothetical protein
VTSDREPRGPDPISRWLGDNSPPPGSGSPRRAYDDAGDFVARLDADASLWAEVTPPSYVFEYDGRYATQTGDEWTYTPHCGCDRCSAYRQLHENPTQWSQYVDEWRRAADDYQPTTRPRRRAPRLRSFYERVRREVRQPTPEPNVGWQLLDADVVYVRTYAEADAAFAAEYLVSGLRSNSNEIDEHGLPTPERLRRVAEWLRRPDDTDNRWLMRLWRYVAATWRVRDEDAPDCDCARCEPPDIVNEQFNQPWSRHLENCRRAPWEARYRELRSRTFDAIRPPLAGTVELRVENNFDLLAEQAQQISVSLRDLGAEVSFITTVSEPVRRLLLGDLPLSLGPDVELDRWADDGGRIGPVDY